MNEYPDTTPKRNLGCALAILHFVASCIALVCFIGSMIGSGWNDTSRSIVFWHRVLWVLNPLVAAIFLLPEQKLNGIAYPCFFAALPLGSLLFYVLLSLLLKFLRKKEARQ